MQGRVLVVMLVTPGLYAGSLLDFSYGVLEELRGNDEKAGEFYESAFADDPTAMHLVRMIAEKLAAGGDLPGAVKVWEDALKNSHGSGAPWIAFGNFLDEVGRGDALADVKREEAYLKALEIAPGGFVPIERLISLAREQGRDERAREILEDLNADSASAVLYYVSTTRSLYDGRDEKASERIDERLAKAMRERPESPELARAASDHYRLTDRLPLAIATLDRHMEARPGSLDLKIRLGILLFSAGEDEKGLGVLHDVLEVHPRKALAHESLAKYYRKTRDTKKARDHLADLLKIRGGGAGEFIELADELLSAGENRAARLLLEKAVFDHGENAELRKRLAIASARDPETREKAGRLFKEAEEMAGGEVAMEPGFLMESAKELLAQGDTEAAEKRLRTAIRSFPPDARAETAAAMRTLADIWIKGGKNEDAARLLIQRAEAMEK